MTFTKFSFCEHDWQTSNYKLHVALSISQNFANLIVVMSFSSYIEQDFAWKSKLYNDILWHAINRLPKIPQAKSFCLLFFDFFMFCRKWYPTFSSTLTDKSKQNKTWSKELKKLLLFIAVLFVFHWFYFQFFSLTSNHNWHWHIAYKVSSS